MNSGSKASDVLPSSELTPVRVRGKRVKKQLRFKKKSKAKRTPRSSRPHSEMGSKPRREVKGCSYRDEKVGVQRRHVSRLESLPVELIERIFFDCLEFNLPRASPSLAAAISSERIYRVLILFVLWNDPDPDETSALPISKAFRPIQYMCLEREARRALQIAVLSCRWCTFSRLRMYLNEFRTLTLQRHWFGGGPNGYGIEMETSEKDRLEKALNEGPEKWGYNFDGRSKQGIKYTIFFTRFGFGVLNRDTSMSIPLFAMTLLAIPDRILGGTPWTSEKLAYLEYLRQFIQKSVATPGVPFSRDRLQDGIHQAIIQQNPRALRNLLELDEYFNRRYDVELHQKGVCYELPAEHFITAVRQSESPTILELLIRGNAESIPYDDAELTAWAVRARDRGEEFGAWLLEFMVDVPRRLQPPFNTSPYRDLFHYGSLNDPGSSLGGRYVRIFGQEPKYWTEEMDISQPSAPFM